MTLVSETLLNNFEQQFITVIQSKDEKLKQISELTLTIKDKYKQLTKQIEAFDLLIE